MTSQKNWMRLNSSWADCYAYLCRSPMTCPHDHRRDDLTFHLRQAGEAWCSKGKLGLKTENACCFANCLARLDGQKEDPTTESPLHHL